MKAMRIFWIVGITAMMTGCSSPGNTVKSTTTSAAQTEIQTTGIEETTEEVQTAAVKESTAAKESTEGIVTEESTSGQVNQKKETEKAAEPSPDDNFTVNMEDAAAFADLIKEAVAQKDLEALANLTAYPVYVNFPDNGTSVESRDALVALGEDQIFTGELVDSVNQADKKNLSPSRAGFVLTKESGAPNIVFGLRDGKLSVVGINY